MLFTPDTEQIFKVALAMTRGVTLEIVRRMQEIGVEAEEFFHTDDYKLSEKFGLKCQLECFDCTNREKALLAARKEVEFLRQHHIKTLFISDDDYPARMAECHSAPIILYQLGDCDLNAVHNVSVVGTRRITPYGADFTRRFVKELGEYIPDLCVWSGLAHGTDSFAHQAAIDSGLTTVAVLAHGLDTIYPAVNRELAKRIIKSGGALLTEYPVGIKPFRGNFLERNRIVAWSTDATVVVESELKGGAMSTANHAFVENREVFALPGRTSDPMSAGCNHLIRNHKAGLLTSAADFIEIIGWQPAEVKVTSQSRSLFPELEGENKVIYETLQRSSEPMSLDSLHDASKLPVANILSILMELEFDGIVIKYPGNRYSNR